MCSWVRCSALHIQCAALPRHSGSRDRATVSAHMTTTRSVPALASTMDNAAERRQRWLRLWLGAGIFMINLDSRVIAPLLPTIATAFHTSVSAAGILISAYMFPYGFFQLVYGPLSDRLGKVKVVAFA